MRVTILSPPASDDDTHPHRLSGAESPWSTMSELLYPLHGLRFFFFFLLTLEVFWLAHNGSFSMLCAERVRQKKFWPLGVGTCPLAAAHCGGSAPASDRQPDRAPEASSSHRMMEMRELDRRWQALRIRRGPPMRCCSDT